MHSDFAAMHVAFPADLSQNAFRDIARDGEAEPFAAARLRENERIDPDDVAVRNPPTDRRYYRD